MRFTSLGTIRVIGAEAYGVNITILQDGRQYIAWGTIYPGFVVNRSFYVKSKSNILVTLNLSISNITFKNSKGESISEAPELKDPLSITWNYNNTLLKPNEEIYVTLTLKASSETIFVDYLVANNVKEFYFDTLIAAVP